MTDQEYHEYNLSWQEWVRTMRAHDEWVRVLQDGINSHESKENES